MNKEDKLGLSDFFSALADAEYKYFGLVLHKRKSVIKIEFDKWIFPKNLGMFRSFPKNQVILGFLGVGTLYMYNELQDTLKQNSITCILNVLSTSFD